MSSIIEISPLNFPWQTKDPFLFCAHHEDFYPEGNEKMGPNSSLSGRNLGNDFVIKDGFRMYHGQEVPGFPAHPHRGFETITIARKGLVDHSDSLGAAGRFGEGDVQWMTAGKGVQHSEMFPLVNDDKENTLEIFQIWLNLPANKKMVEPYFAMLWSEDIPEVEEHDELNKQTKIRLIAGQYKGHAAPPPSPDSWARIEENEVCIWTIKMEAGAKWTIPASSAGLNRNVYFFKGDSIQIENETVPNYTSIQVSSENQIEIENGKEEAEILFLQGRPINEPVVQYGPFVMNSEQGIRDTMNEYGRTQFGGWPWPKHDNVHDRDSKRFAKYADGKLEERELK